MTVIRRRDFLAGGAAAAGMLALGPNFWRAALAAPATVGDGPYGPLQAPDANGLMLPSGFRSREIARAGSPVAGTGYTWHNAPDGQATFAQPDGSFVLVSNSETAALQGGGTSALRLDPQGNVIDAYRICEGTSGNCAGGRTPWGTWLTCEEYGGGQVWECDPLGVRDAVVRPAMGTFNHEAVAVDPVQRRLYLTEDEGDGCFYRFTPDAYPDLSSGVLQVAVVSASNQVSWRTVPDPLGVLVSTRKQVRSAKTFRGGEGIWFDEGFIYFTTKGDHTLWAYDTVRRTIEKLYDPATSGNGDFLHGPDNLTVARSGDVFVCEDNGDDDFDIVMVTPERTISPVVRASSVSGIHSGSEFAGVIFSPDGERMYFSSQRGHGDGAVFEVTGPFRPARPSDDLPEEEEQQPVDEQPLPPQQPAARPPRSRPVVTIEDVDAPGVRISARSRVTFASLRRDGLVVTAQVDEAATLTAVLRTAELVTTPGKRGSEARPVDVLLGRATATVEAGSRQLKLKLSAKEAKRIESALAAQRRRGRTAQLRARLSVQAIDAAGNVRIATRAVVVTQPPAPHKKRRAAVKRGRAI
jgi:secreted PhoX family phosphatase